MFLTTLASMELTFSVSAPHMRHNFHEIVPPLLDELIAIKRKQHKQVPSIQTFKKSEKLVSLLKPFIDLVPFDIEKEEKSTIVLSKYSFDSATIKLINAEIPSKIAFKNDPELQHATPIKTVSRPKKSIPNNAERLISRLEFLLDNTDEKELSDLKWHKLIPKTENH